MLGRETNPYNAWPRVRRVKPGVFRVKGRVVPVMTWLMMRRLAGLLAFLFTLWLLGAALLPWLVNLPDMLGPAEPPASFIIGTMMDFRFFLRELLTERYPHVGKAILYTGQNPYDWHLLGVFVIAYRLRPVLGFLLTRLLVVALWPLLARGFKITFTSDCVTIHGWLGLPSKKLRRGGVGTDVSFHTAEPQYQTGLLGLLLRSRRLQPGGEADFCMVLAVVGHRRIKIASPRLRLDAQRVVESCQLAMSATRTMM